MASNKPVEHGLKMITEIYDQGDIMCELDQTTIITRKSTDDGGQAYGKINVLEGTQWHPIRLPQDVLLEKCKLLGSDQIVGVVSGKRLGVYDTHGHHVRLIDVQKKGRVKTVENINAVAVITDKILVAESQRYNNLIHVVDYQTGEATMSLTIDQKITGIIPIKNGLVLVRLKDKIQSVDYANYPRVEITEVIAYGRTLVNMCVKGGNDELYVMFVKGVTSKVLEIHVLDDKYQELHKTRIKHHTSIFSLRAVYTSQGPGYLVIQMGSTIFTFTCSFGHRKGPAEENKLKSLAKKKFYAKRQLPPPSRLSNIEKDNTEQSQPDKEKDAEESTGSGESPSDEMSKIKQMSTDFGPVIVDSKVSKNIEKLDRKPTDENAPEKTELYKGKLDDIEPRRHSTPPKPIGHTVTTTSERTSVSSGKDSFSGKPTDENAPEKTELYKGKLDGIEPRRHSTPPKPIGHTVTTTSERTSVSSGKDSFSGKRMVTSAAQTSDRSETIHRNLNELHQMPGEPQNTSGFESSYIGEEGGVIQSSKYGFSLSIPPGAIPKGQRKKIGVGLSRDHGASRSGGGVSISPMICSEPSGLELEKPVRFDLQHCLSSWSNDTHVNVHEMADDGKRGGETEGHTGAKCSIGTNGKLALEVTRLGRYSLTVMGSEVYKKLVCRPFIPKKMPTTKKPIINVLIYDLTDGMKQMMMEEMENDSPYPIIPAHVGKNFIFNLSGKDAPEILLTCHAVGSIEVKSLSASELIEIKSNSVDFQVDCSDGQAKDITIQLSFGNKKIDMICHVDIPFAGHEHHSTPPRKPSSPSSDIDHQTDVPSQVLHEIAEEVPHNSYIPFGLKLGLEKPKLDSILVGCGNDSEEATYRAMEVWKNRIGVDNRERLRAILIAGDLKRIAEKYLN